jgi:hypothetical protein
MTRVQAAKVAPFAAGNEAQIRKSAAGDFLPNKGYVSMHRRQRGITAIGWLFLLVPIAIVGYAAVRLTPVYLNYMKVARSLEQLASSTEGTVTLRDVRNALQRYFDIESVDYPSMDDITIRRDKGTWIVQAQYDDAAPLFANISVLVEFDKSVTLD